MPTKQNPLKELKSKLRLSKNLIIALIIIITLIIAVAAWAGLTKAGYIENYLKVKILYNNDQKKFEPWDKPIIYLYPQTPTNVTVTLNYQGEIIADYPNYDPIKKGWEVIAYPDGQLINQADKLNYSYLFWEGIPDEPVDYDLTQGFVVKGEDTKSFLQNKLAEIGLTPKEYNEFIVYWYPKMKNNKYTLIHFADREYTDTAPLTIAPQPDSVLRVFMVIKPLAEPIEIEPQEFKPFARSGFSVVEWGGTELK